MFSTHTFGEVIESRYHGVNNLGRDLCLSLKHTFSGVIKLELGIQKLQRSKMEYWVKFYFQRRL